MNFERRHTLSHLHSQLHHLYSLRLETVGSCLENFDTTMIIIVRFLFPILLICVSSRHVAGKMRSVFYIMGSDGIYVINPQKSYKYLEAKITNTSSPGLCTRSKRGSKSACLFSEACVVNKFLYLADVPGSAVKVIDLDTQKKTETIPTDPYPYGLYNVPWRKEVWVHSWTNGTFDVIDTDARIRTHKAVRAHTKPGWTHGIMLAQRDLFNGEVGYVSHMWNPGVHKINLKTKAYSGFRNMTSEGCVGTYGIVYSPVNKSLFIECRSKSGNTIVQMQVPSGNIVKTWDILGTPFVSPNGRHIVMLYAPVNETTNQLLDSRMNVLEFKGTGITKHPELLIPGGVSRIVFYAKTSGSYYAFVTLKYASRIAVVDLDLVKNGELSDVTYIDNVDELNTRAHPALRGIFAGGKWIVSPASKSKTVVIIDADTRKLHGKVRNVNGGGFAIWVDAESNGGVSHIDIAHKMVLGLITITVLCFFQNIKM